MLQLDGAHRVKASVAAFACVACICSSAPASAVAGAGDVAATRAYLRASYAYEHSIDREAPAGAAAVNAGASQIAGECPFALTYAPRDEAFWELGEAVSTALATLYWAGVPSMRAQKLHLAGEIAHLRWSNRRLTRLVHVEAAEERAIATLAFPDVCADIAEWKGSAYSTLAPDMSRYLARVHAIEALSFVGIGFTEESREAIVRRLLGPYEGPAERRVVKRTERLEAKVGARFGAAQASQRKLAAALGVSTL